VQRHHVGLEAGDRRERIAHLLRDQELQLVDRERQMALPLGREAARFLDHLGDEGQRRAALGRVDQCAQLLAQQGVVARSLVDPGAPLRRRLLQRVGQQLLESAAVQRLG